MSIEKKKIIIEDFSEKLDNEGFSYEHENLILPLEVPASDAEGPQDGISLPASELVGHAHFHIKTDYPAHVQKVHESNKIAKVRRFAGRVVSSIGWVIVFFPVVPFVISIPVGGSIVVVGKSIRDGEWNPKRHWREVRREVKKVTKRVISALRKSYKKLNPAIRREAF